MPNNIIDFEPQNNDSNNKEIQVTLDDDAKSVLKLNSPELDRFKKYLQETPHQKYSYKDLFSYAKILSNLQHFQLAINYTKKAINKDLKNFDYFFLLADCLYCCDLFEEAMEWVEKLPDGYKRKSYLKATIVNKLEGFEKAVPLFENAIKEEPKFILPYLTIGSECDLGGEEANYWMELGFKNIPDEPILAYGWSREKLKRGEIEKLASDKIIRSPKYDSGVEVKADFHNENLVYTKIAKINQVTASMILNQDETLLTKIAFSINDIDDHNHWKCNVSFRCSAFAAVQGNLQYTDIFSSYLCEKCKLDNDPNILKFDSLINAGMIDTAKEIGNQIFDKYVKLNTIYETIDVFYRDYITLLHHTGESAKALSIGSELVNKIKFNNQKAEFIQIMQEIAKSLGEWKVCNFFNDKFGELDFKELYNHTYRDETLLNIVTGFFYPIIIGYPYRSAICQIALKYFNQASDTINSMPNQKIKFLSPEYSLIFDEFEKEYKDKIQVLFKLCKENSNDKFYSNYFQNQMNKLDLHDSVGKIEKLDNRISISNALSHLNSEIIPEKINALRTVYRQELRDNNDYSEIINSIEKEIPQIRLAPDAAFSSIIQAEASHLSYTSSFDEAPSIIAYTKSLELTLRHIVFGKFRKESLELSNFDVLIEEAKNDKNYSKYSGLLNYLKNGKIELGVMHLSILFSRGKTAKRVKLLQMLHNYITTNYPILLDEKTISELGDLISNYRNKATHERSFNQQELEFVRSKTFEFLKMILGIRAV